MTLTDADIREAIRKTVLNVDAASIAADSDFYDVGIDSLDHSSILLELQERHNLSVPDDQLAACRSIQGILKYAASH